MICFALPASANTGGTAISSRVGSRSAVAGVRGQAKVWTCTITVSVLSLRKVTTAERSAGPSSTRVGATLSEAPWAGTIQARSARTARARAAERGIAGSLRRSA